MRFVGSKISILHGSQRWLSPQAVPAGQSLGWMMLWSWQTSLGWFCIERGQNRKGLCSLVHWQHAEGWNSLRTDLLFLEDWGWLLVPKPKQSTSSNICAWHSSNLTPGASHCQENFRDSLLRHLLGEAMEFIAGFVLLKELGAFYTGILWGLSQNWTVRMKYLREVNKQY